MLDCWINIGSCLPFPLTYIANFYERAQAYLIGEAEAFRGGAPLPHRPITKGKRRTKDRQKHKTETPEDILGTIGENSKESELQLDSKRSMKDTR
jgi:hypothetical protein